MKKTNMALQTTKRGYPALWEEGGGYSNTGYATIIAGPNGEPLFPVYINRRGRLCCGLHALFIVQPGYLVVEADHHRRDFVIDVYRIRAIHEEEGRLVADVDRVNRFSRGEWEVDLQPELEEPVRAAKEKATCYHCNRPVYVASDNYWGHEEAR